MRIRMKIYNKMLILVLFTTTVVFGISIGIVSQKIKDNSIETSKSQTQSNAKALSQKAKLFIQEYIVTAKTIDNLFLVHDDINEKERQTIYETVIKNILFNSPNFLSINTSVEPSTVFEDDRQINISYTRTQNTIDFDSSDLSVMSQYLLSQKNMHETVLPPHQYQYDNTTVIQNSYCVPIIEGDQFLGATSINGYSSDFQSFLSSFKSNKKDQIFVVDYNNTIISHSEDSLVGKNMTELGFDTLFTSMFENCRAKSESSVIEGYFPFSQHSYFISFAPFKISENTDNYVLVLASPSWHILKEAKKNYYLSFLSAVIGLIVLTVFIWFVARFITKLISSLTVSLQNVAIGDISFKNKLKIKTNDEISDTAKSVNRLIDGLNLMAGFASEIEKGNLDAEYKLLSKNDLLGKSLNKMRQSLVQAKIEENIQKEIDDKQTWVTQGIAHFVEILRQNNDNLELLSENIVSNICSYMNKPQCALYIINDDFEEVEFELIAAHAYGFSKIIDKKVKIGEELIGRVALDKKTLHIENTTEDFPIIKPELVTDKVPTSALIAPLISGEVMMGVVEILGYEPFEEHEIEFIDKLGANIASTFNSAKTNIKTAVLLKQSHEQKDVLAQHEEEMRQNMEEMLATQEESEKRERELNAVLDIINKNTMYATLSPEGKIVKISESFAILFGLPVAQMVDKYLDAFTTPDDASKKEQEQLWAEVLSGNSQKKIQKVEIRKQTMYLSETYIPIVKDDDEFIVEQITLVAVDVTKKVEYDREIAMIISDIETYTK
ncbi:MAG TPA: GAF domain-containing protein [Salinivirgaceae bacterium]|nr:GAF domain-containing protein [Salinivirgaceae bacterium]HQA75605.1 GAF domain-containing protein [Salinivirgaceae bacterium]